jgi:small GTP-binding protein
MIQKKICILGAFATGKTSLVRRFVKGIFSESYLTTVGVKIDKKEMKIEGRELHLILWDLSGEDQFQKVRVSYLRGASGYFLVVDGTRGETLDTARSLQTTVEEACGPLPFVLMCNKMDLTDEWELGETALEDFSKKGWTVLKTSAKTGHGVEEAFSALAGKLLEG